MKFRSIFIALMVASLFVIVSSAFAQGQAPARPVDTTIEYHIGTAVVDSMQFSSFVAASRHRAVAALSSATTELPGAPFGWFAWAGQSWKGEALMQFHGESPFIPLGGKVEIFDNGKKVGDMSANYVASGNLKLDLSPTTTASTNGSALVTTTGTHMIEQRWYPVDNAYYAVKATFEISPIGSYAGVCRDANGGLNVQFRLDTFERTLAGVGYSVNGKSLGSMAYVQTTQNPNVYMATIHLSDSEYNSLQGSTATSFNFFTAPSPLPGTPGWGTGIGVMLFFPSSQIVNCDQKG